MGYSMRKCVVNVSGKNYGENRYECNDLVRGLTDVLV
jgi:hypothetical protein